jgi:hypothetical protein
MVVLNMRGGELIKIASLATHLHHASCFINSFFAIGLRLRRDNLKEQSTLI